MRFISNKGITDPSINLALEEYILRSLPDNEDYLLFYINEPSIIIGKNQNTVSSSDKACCNRFSEIKSKSLSKSLASRTG
ncbi:hypothetical protein PAAL109150_13805 [Paenibacillus alkaliterrae]